MSRRGRSIHRTLQAIPCRRHEGRAGAEPRHLGRGGAPLLDDIDLIWCDDGQSRFRRPGSSFTARPTRCANCAPCDRRPSHPYRGRWRHRSGHRAPGRGGWGGCAGRGLGGVFRGGSVSNSALMARISARSATPPRPRCGDLARRIGAGRRRAGTGGAVLRGGLARLALTGPKVAPGGIWLHAASVGELTSSGCWRRLARDFRWW